MSANRGQSHKKRNLAVIAAIAVLALPLYSGWSTPAPEGTSYISPPSTVTGLRLLYDLTYLKGEELIHDQIILDEQIRMIREAKDFILADIFLYNDYYNTEKYRFPASTEGLSDALIAQKQRYPELKAYLITDEITKQLRF
jgi:hypothetical protein